MNYIFTYEKSFTTAFDTALKNGFYSSIAEAKEAALAYYSSLDDDDDDGAWLNSTKTIYIYGYYINTQTKSIIDLRIELIESVKLKRTRKWSIETINIP